MVRVTGLAALLWLSLASGLHQAAAADPNSDSGLPADFPQFTITQTGETAPGVLVGSVRSTNEDMGSYFLVLDNSGAPLFYRRTESLGELECNGLFSAPKEMEGLKEKYAWCLQNEWFEEVAVLQMGNGYLADNHAFQLLPNGHALMLCSDDQIIDLSGMVDGGHPAARVTGAVIQELDADKRVVFQWRTWDHIPITDSYSDITKESFGYVQVTAVSLDPLDGNLIVCCRDTSEVVKVGRVTGEVLWRMGGKRNEFTFLNEHQENAPRYFQLIHDARRLPNGHLTMFDNGGAQGGTHSRAVEYALDEENRTATLVWEYRREPDIQASAGGSVRRLPGGHTLINWGGASTTEVDPNGRLVYDIACARAGVTADFSRILWPPAGQAVTVTRYELMEGNTYAFDNDHASTGVSLRVTSLDGEGYNEAYATREPFAPLFPEFPGKAPRVLPVRVTVAARGITAMTGALSFDAASFGCADRSGAFGYVDPNVMTVYHRPSAGAGMFLPVSTDYNPVTRQLRAAVSRLGEFILCFPDLEETPYAPLLIQPRDHETVNPQLPVSFFWTPRGFGRSYDLQVSRDPNFMTLDVDEIDLAETRYTLPTLAPGEIWFWRVRTINEGGISDWSSGSFAATEPAVWVLAPPMAASNGNGAGRSSSDGVTTSVRVL